MHLHEAHARVTVDGHVGELPTSTVHRFVPIGCGAMVRAPESSDFLGVEVRYVDLASSGLFFQGDSSVTPKRGNSSFPVPSG
jgi:hypothetical protein